MNFTPRAQILILHILVLGRELQANWLTNLSTYCKSKNIGQFSQIHVWLRATHVPSYHNQIILQHILIVLRGICNPLHPTCLFRPSWPGHALVSDPPAQYQPHRPGCRFLWWSSLPVTVGYNTWDKEDLIRAFSSEDISWNHDNTWNSVEPSVTLTITEINSNHATWISATVLSTSRSFPSICYGLFLFSFSAFLVWNIFFVV